MTKSEPIKALEKKVRGLEAHIKHLTNELYLTKEEYETSANNYFDIYSNMEKIIETRTKKLLQSREKYRSIFENIIDVYYEATLDGKILEVSPSVEVISKFSRKELIGKSLYDLYQDPKERDELVIEFLNKEKVSDYEVHLTDKNGSIVACSITSKLITDKEGTPVKIVGTMRDISERKSAEEALQESEQKLKISERELKSIVNNAPDIIFRVDPDGKIVFINDAIKEYGFSIQELIGKNIIELVHPEDRKKAVFSVKEKRTGARRTKLFETRLISKGFRSIPFESNYRDFGSFLINAEGIYSSEKPGSDSFVGSIVVARDVSERKRIEVQTQQAQKLEAIGVLAGGLAHDFNNLLSVIVGNIELAKNEVKFEAGVSDLLTEVEKASLRAHILTKQLITFSEGGAPAKKIGHIGKLMKESTGVILPDSNANCEFYLPHDLWSVEFDKGQMMCAIQNIIVNATESMPKGGTIDVRAENFIAASQIEQQGLILPKGKYVKISIQDHGIGIPEEHLSMLFDPYFTTKEMGAQKGVGLGLATAYSIITRHDGRIIVESEVGVGTTFTLYLPASEKNAGELKPVEIDKPEKTAMRTGKILVMDDEEMIRKLAKQVLKQYGYDAELAKDGVEAIELYRKAMDSDKPFDAVMLDLTVNGGKGGKETVKSLLKINPQIKAIVSSGYSNDPVMTDFRKYGFMEALPKPYSIKDLYHALNKVTTRKS